MPWRSESFVPQGEESVYQGRIYKDKGSHYWGSYTQGSYDSSALSSTKCVDRYTYLVVTNLQASNAAIGTIALSIVAN